MKFSAYDILSSLIPGFILFGVMAYVFNYDYDVDLILIYTAGAFLLGYIVNALGSWLEDVYYFTWGGKPSEMLLKGKGIWKVKLSETAKIKQLLTDDCFKENPQESDLFSVACRYVNSHNPNSRSRDFNAHYAFSRTVLTVVLISTILLLIHNYCDWRFYLLFVLLFVVWLRAKQRGYYYAKEVLSEYLTLKTNNIK
jgi:hypothetical protein